MKQLLLPHGYAGEPRLRLSGAEFRHVARVLRLREGDRLGAVDRGGAHYDLVLVRVGRTDCEVSLTPRAPARPAPAITLLQCLPKGRKIDLIVRQATEAGVRRIVLLVSERTVVRPAESDARSGRLLRIAEEALQQSGGAALPRIDGPLAYSCIAGESWGTALLLLEHPVRGTSLHGLLAGRPAAVSLLVGPEGGLTADEAALAAAAGFRAVHFSTGVLRVETAATFALGAVMSILQESDEWRLVQSG
ncbi:MAG TPA: RsmE family RNA methyltransferase [Spirochaetia bacterium]|nr:RsmE family RNA methyltransferase [Spirochaetia bacterium]